MKWLPEDDRKPPFGQAVLGWNECKSCLQKEKHVHNMRANGFPSHGPFLAMYHPPDPTVVNFYRSKGDHSWDWALLPHWSPIKPKYWAIIPTPYELS